VNKPEKIADAAEVLEYLTACMRGEANGSGAIKAAELLAKRYGLLTERGAASAEVPYIIDDIMPTDDTEGGASDG